MKQQNPMDEYSIMMEQQKQQTQNDPNALYADYMREEKVANVISQLDPSNLIGDIEHSIRGDKKDPITKIWETNPRQKKVSEELINDFVSFLRSMLTQNTTMSNYSIQEINNRMEMIIEWIRDNLTDNDIKYKIVGDYNEMSRIGIIICEAVSSAFKRALNGMESRRIFSSLRVNESLTQHEKKGLGDALKFW